MSHMAEGEARIPQRDERIYVTLAQFEFLCRRNKDRLQQVGK